MRLATRWEWKILRSAASRCAMGGSNRQREGEEDATRVEGVRVR